MLVPILTAIAIFAWIIVWIVVFVYAVGNFDTFRKSSEYPVADVTWNDTQTGTMWYGTHPNPIFFLFPHPFPKKKNTITIGISCSSVSGSTPSFRPSSSSSSSDQSVSGTSKGKVSTDPWEDPSGGDSKSTSEVSPSDPSSSLSSS